MTAVPQVTLPAPSLKMRKTEEMMRFCPDDTENLTGQFLQEFLFIEPIFEGLSSVDENHRNFVSELALEQVVGFYVYFAPAEAAPPLQLRQLFLHDLAKVAPLAGVNDNFAQDGHRAESSKPENSFPVKVLSPGRLMHKRVKPVL
jgi:hypothetical protein